MHYNQKKKIFKKKFKEKLKKKKIFSKKFIYYNKEEIAKNNIMNKIWLIIQG